MVWPLQQSPLGGNLGATTCSVFRLDPMGLAALEPIADILPGVTPLRVTFDMVDGETAVYEYGVTEHSIQSFIDVTTNVHKRLETITITGTLGATPPLLPMGSVPFPPGLRLDLMRVANLKAIADSSSPIMLVTPRVGLAKALITSIQQVWSPAHGDSTLVTLTVKEARIVSIITGDLIAPDYPGQTPGNNEASGGGQSSTTAAGETATPSGTTGVPPS